MSGQRVLRPLRRRPLDGIGPEAGPPQQQIWSYRDRVRSTGVSERPSTNPVYRFFFAVDAWCSTGFYEIRDRFRRMWSAYSALLDRVRIGGPPRLLFELVSDGATLGLLFALGVLYYALPPFSGTGDIWNQGRDYAVTFTDSSGEIIGRRGIRQDDAIPLDEIPQNVVRAVLATEDQRFMKHFGLDIQGTLRALVENLRAKDVVQGGSTLTQQLAKNLFLNPERTLQRKVNEAFLALWIEARLTKPEILKLYLDRSYLGGGTYGVEAAAQFYFGKSIRDVNLSEAAMLAGLFKAPSNFAPHVNPEAARARANVVLYRMLDAGVISQGELLEARRNPAEFASERDHYSPDWFLDWAYEETLATLKTYGLETEYVIEVKTTIDMAMQRTGQTLINEMLDKEGEERHVTQGALVSLTPRGAVKAIVGGRDYEDSQFNRAIDALRQPGSAFKPFVYMAALRAGYHPNTVVYDVPITVGNWTPKNYTRRYTGRTTLVTALKKSYNTIPVHIAQNIGRKAIIQAAELAGLRTKLSPVPSLPLGTNEVTLIDLTSAYAGFANGGHAITPYTVLEIKRPNGEVLYSRDTARPAPPQTLEPELVEELNYMLNQVVRSGTGRRALLGFTPQAGKTGTNQDYRDAWFMGFTAHYVTGVWYGNDDFTPMKRITGGSLPAMTWKSFMEKALETKVAEALPGVPLDDSYARYIARQDEGQEAPVVGGTADELPTRVTVDTTNSRQQVPERRERRADPVVRVLQSMFSLFSGSGESAPPPRRAEPPRRQVDSSGSARQRRTPNFSERRRELEDSLR